jgi:L-alanine-DL-glutamate epimerase-like enolase superfamily enzyme
LPPLHLSAQIESWPLAKAFIISRGSKTEARVVVALVNDGECFGWGECVPYARYGETVENALAAILAMQAPLAAGLSRDALKPAMPPGAARNALDCALWDYEAKRSGRTVADLAGRAALEPVTTAFTISLDTPEAMAAAAHDARHMPLLKLKLGGEGDDARLRAVRAAAPSARLIADANEAWTPALYPALMAACAETGVEVVEQPLPAANDAELANLPRAVPICADESFREADGLHRLAQLYDAVNIKLDKAGGLTQALAQQEAAEALGLKVMVGCMVATSLAMAPALILAQRAAWVDLDGPLLLARDREDGLRYSAGVITPPPRSFWG